MAAFRKSVPVRVQVCSSSGTTETVIKTTKSSTVGFILRSVAFWLPEKGKGYGLLLPDGHQLHDMGAKLGVYKLQPYDVIQVKRFFPGIISVHVGSTEQSFQVSMDSSVREITQQICKETSISDAENYSLVLMEGGSGFCEEAENEVAQGKWLSADMTLDQLGVDNMSKLQLRKLPQGGHEDSAELILDKGTSVTVGSHCESRLVEKKRLPVLFSSVPRRDSTPSPTTLQTILEDSESKTESQGVASSGTTPDLDSLSFEELEAYLAVAYGEIMQVGKKQMEVNSAAEKSSQQVSGQNSDKQLNGGAESLSWDIVDSEMQKGSEEVKINTDKFQTDGGKVSINAVEVQMSGVEVQMNSHVDSPLDDDGCTDSGMVVPNACFTDVAGLPIVEPQATSTPLKVERRYNSCEGKGASEGVLEGSHKAEPERDAAVTTHRVEQKEAEPFPKALPDMTLSPQEALQSLWPVSPPDLEEGYSQPAHQPPSSFTTQLQNQLNAVAAMKPHPPKGGAVDQGEKKQYYNTYSSGMHRGSDVEEALGQHVGVQLHAYPGATLPRYFEPLKDTWPRRQMVAMETPYNDSGIGCSPAVIHSSRKSTPGMLKSSHSLDLVDGEMSSVSTSRPTSYRDSVLTSAVDGGALVYPEDQRKATIPISDSTYGKQSEVILSQGDDEVFSRLSPIQPGKNFTFHLPDIKTPSWSRLGASSCSQQDYLSSETLLTERNAPSWEYVPEAGDEVPIFGSRTKRSKQKKTSDALAQQRMVTTGRTLQRSSSSPDVRVMDGEDDHLSITSADSTTWRLDYYKMDFPDVVSKYTVVYIIVMDQDLRPFLVNPKKNVQDIIREICCTFRMGNPSQWHFCMPKGLQVVLSKATSASRQTMLSVGSMGSGMTKKTFFHLSTDLVSKEDSLDGGRPLIDQFPFTGKPYVIHMRRYESKFSGSLDGLLEERDIGCEWPDGEVEAKTRCFHQTWCSIAQSHCPVEKHISAEIAALLLQAYFGNYSKSDRRMSEVLPHFLPEMYRTKRNVLKQTKKIYKRLKGITAQHAMQSVITRFREQPGHDGIFFHVKVVHENKSKLKANKLKAGIFGMCFREVIYLDSKTAKVIFRRNYNEIKSVEASKRHFKLDFGAHVSDPFAASSPVALEVMNILKLFIQMHPIPTELHPQYQAYSVSQASLPLQNNPQVEVIQI